MAPLVCRSSASTRALHPPPPSAPPPPVWLTRSLALCPLRSPAALSQLNAAVAPQELVTLADIPAGTAGALLNVKFDAADSTYHYLEACMRAMIDGADTPLFLSSGAEDYFLSAYCKEIDTLVTMNPHP